MRIAHPAVRLALGALAGLSAATAAIPTLVHAQTLAAEPALRRTIHVPRDKSLSYRLTQPASRIVVANPEIAKVTPTSDASFYVQGVEFGATDLLVYGPGGRLAEMIDVRVGYDGEALQSDLAAVFPNERIRVRSLGDRLLLEGEVSNAGVAKQAREIAEEYAEPGAVTSNLIARATQIVLQVRVLEMTRAASQDLGVKTSLQGTFQDRPFSFVAGQTGIISSDLPHGTLSLQGRLGNTFLDVQIQALEQRGMVRTLARPNLVALSGEKATFLAGGEFPFPVPQDRVTDRFSVDFKPYGVKVDFLPVMLADGRIRLAVAPEVSQLDFGNSLRLASFTVPALTTRRTNTTVELRPGESLAIGGLLERDYLNAIKQYPFLGDIPYLGSLFRSSRWKRNETELVIIVTPEYITDEHKAQAASQISPAGETPNDRDLQFKGKSLDRKIPDPTPGPESR